MTFFRYPYAHFDFHFDAPLDVVAALLSERIFVGIPFEGENTGIWDEVPAVKLSRDYLGLRVELGGGLPHGYTIDIDPFDLLGEISKDDPDYGRADVTTYVQELFKQIDGITLCMPGCPICAALPPSET